MSKCWRCGSCSASSAGDRTSLRSRPTYECRKLSVHADTTSSSAARQLRSIGIARRSSSEAFDAIGPLSAAGVVRVLSRSQQSSSSSARVLTSEPNRVDSCTPCGTRKGKRSRKVVTWARRRREDGWWWWWRRRRRVRVEGSWVVTVEGSVCEGEEGAGGTAVAASDRAPTSSSRSMCWSLAGASMRFRTISPRQRHAPSCSCGWRMKGNSKPTKRGCESRAMSIQLT